MLIGERQLQQLQSLNLSSGYCVLDGFFENDHAEELLQEMKELQKSGIMKVNQVELLVPQGKVVVTKPGIFEADMFNDELRNYAPLKRFRELYAVDAEHLTKNLPAEYMLDSSTKGRVLKLQYNDGTGGCFPWHYDNPGPPNNRSLTCAIYLNKQWEEGHGGAIAFQPFLGTEIVVPPKFNRMVVFQSDKLLHKVTPANHERFCFTLWIDGNNVNQQEDLSIDLRRIDVRSMASSAQQRIVARAVYRDEFKKSIRDCMANNPNKDMAQCMLEHHEAHIKNLESNPKLKQLVEILVSMKGTLSQ